MTSYEYMEKKKKKKIGWVSNQFNWHFIGPFPSNCTHFSQAPCDFSTSFSVSAAAAHFKAISFAWFLINSLGQVVQGNRGTRGTSNSPRTRFATIYDSVLATYVNASLCWRCSEKLSAITEKPVTGAGVPSRWHPNCFPLHFFLIFVVVFLHFDVGKFELKACQGKATVNVPRKLDWHVDQWPRSQKAKGNLRLHTVSVITQVHVW